MANNDATGRSFFSPCQPYLERYQHTDALHAVIPSVYVIAHEQVIGVRTVAAYSEQLQQVCKLPMDVSTCIIRNRLGLHKS
jgi:hypothetical protein